MILKMRKGRSVSRETKLANLQKQGMDYIADKKYFFCRHCKVSIKPPDHQKAVNHMRNAKHLHFQESRIRVQR